YIIDFRTGRPYLKILPLEQRIDRPADMEGKGVRFRSEEQDQLRRWSAAADLGGKLLKTLIPGGLRRHPVGVRGPAHAECRERQAENQADRSLSLKSFVPALSRAAQEQ